MREPLSQVPGLTSQVSTVDRRTFLGATGAGLLVSSRAAPFFTTRGSPGAKVVVAIMGLNSRGSVLARGFVGPTAEVAYLCDVDAQVLAKSLATLSEAQPKQPRAVGDFRRVLDDKAVDAIVIAAPDHWHTPAAMLALQAGKHVYLEKPGGHNAHEGELLVAAQHKHRRLVQLGTQQRSAPHSIEVIDAIRQGLIGRPYLARAWYANTRGPIGRGRKAPVPAGLDYELWQGPAPRTPYRDNVIHYNWHWFRRWGTGEICNNGTHEIDVCRWALGVDFPVRVVSAGGRYHFADDWEFWDTQEAGFEFTEGKTVVWSGQSCNGFPTHGRPRGVSVHGTEGTVILDRNGYAVYDPKNVLTKEVVAPEQSEGTDPAAADWMTKRHIDNFLDAVRNGAPLRAPIEDGRRSTLLCHLGNIAQRTGRALRIDPRTGRISGDPDAMRLWRRDYAPGWAPVV